MFTIITLSNDPGDMEGGEEFWQKTLKMLSKKTTKWKHP